MVIAWTKARLWPKELEGSWVWQWDKYGDWQRQPELVWVPLGLERNKKMCWGKWFASRDFDWKARKLSDSIDDLPFVNYYGGDFLIIHFSSYNILKYPLVVERFLGTDVSIPDNIAILTFATDNIAAQSLLLRQLDRCGIGYSNLAPTGQPWVHYYKFHGLSDALPKIKQDYVLILDGIDVLLCQSLESIIDRFNVYGKDVVFGAQRGKWPKEAEIPGEDDNQYGVYQYLNSGTVFGRTKAVNAFFEKAWSAQKENKIHNDQLPCRMAFCESRNIVELDYRCSMFQNVNTITCTDKLMVVV